MSGGGLTDKETLTAIMRQTRDQLHRSARLRELAEKGLRPPHQLDPDETRELCSAVMRHVQKGGIR